MDSKQAGELTLSEGSFKEERESIGGEHLQAEEKAEVEGEESASKTETEKVGVASYMDCPLV